MELPLTLSCTIHSRHTAMYRLDSQKAIETEFMLLDFEHTTTTKYVRRTDSSGWVPIFLLPISAPSLMMSSMSTQLPTSSLRNTCVEVSSERHVIAPTAAAGQSTKLSISSLPVDILDCGTTNEIRAKGEESSSLSSVALRTELFSVVNHHLRRGYWL